MGQVMDTLAVVLEGPERLALARLSLCEVAPEDVVVDIEWSGISTGTERLLWSGRMPPFPGMGYPLVPGYESVGRISALGAAVAGTRPWPRIISVERPPMSTTSRGSSEGCRCATPA